MRQKHKQLGDDPQKVLKPCIYKLFSYEQPKHAKKMVFYLPTCMLRIST